MKNKVIIMFSIFLVFVLVNRYFAYCIVLEKGYQVDEFLVYDLLNKRIHIMNNGLYTDEDIDTIIADLRGIERDKLLDEDVSAIKEARDNPTDFPLVKGLKIIKINGLRVTDNTYKLESLIEWNICYNTFETHEDIKHVIEIQQRGEGFYLISFESIE